jgi:hypothetical protein
MEYALTLKTEAVFSSEAAGCAYLHGIAVQKTTFCIVVVKT